MKTETIAILKNGLMDISLKLSPKLFRAEFARVLIGDNEQASNDQSVQDLAHDTDWVVRGEML